MHRLAIPTFLVVLASTSAAFAAGSITHTYLARSARAWLQHGELRALLEAHDRPYVIGSGYPDSGYQRGTSYGEDSHWDPFIDAFADHLRAKSSQPQRDFPDLVAFLMGCATHRVSDDIWHWTFINEVAARDFNNNLEAAHHYADKGLDFVITVDKAQWLHYPTPLNWWVPVADLEAVYRRMGKNYKAAEIRKGNRIYMWAGVGERIAAAFSARFYRRKAPWTVANYDTTPHGGLQVNAQAVAAYLDTLWTYLTGASAERPRLHRTWALATVPMSVVHEEAPFADAGTEALARDLVRTDEAEDAAGNVTFVPSVIQPDAYWNLLQAADSSS